MRFNFRLVREFSILAGLVFIIMTLSLCSSDRKITAYTITSPVTTVPFQKEPVYVGVRGNFDPRYPQFNSPDYWADTAIRLSENVPDSKPCLLWIVGLAADDKQSCVMAYPSRNRMRNAQFKDADVTERCLELFDRKGLSVWLQVEPAEANVNDLIRSVLSRYSRHSCVKGFAVDLEWYQYRTWIYGKPLSDDDARDWLSTIREYQPSYTLVLKHWLPTRLPPNAREGIYFLTDSQHFDGFQHQQDEFQKWGKNFSPSSVGYQIGYQEDEDWWKKLPNPFLAIAKPLLQNIPNAKMVLWVNFTIRRLYPK